MKLLWTISNWKRTGPLEPSLDLAAAMAARGHEVAVAVGRAPRQSDDEATVCAADRGLAVADTGARLHKHAWFLRDLRDTARLRRYLRRERPDWIVTTLRNDHRLLLRAAREEGPPVARLWFGDGTAAPEARDLAAMHASRAVFAFSVEAERRLEAAGVASEAVIVTGPPLDVSGLRGRVNDPEEVRLRFGVPSGDFLFGIVARMQLHRRFELLWDAVARLQERGAPLHLLVIGRGTNRERVGHRPVAERSLESMVTFTGYLRGSDYASVLAALDGQLLLVPGSDPTCRALREGMALGVPGIATRRGMLPEIVADGETGRLVDETAESLAGVMEAWARDPSVARALGAVAQVRAEAHYDAARVAEVVETELARRTGTSTR